MGARVAKHLSGITIGVRLSSMHENQIIYRELHDALLWAEGVDPLNELILPWLQTTAQEQTWLQAFARRTGVPWPTATTEELWRLYALSRLNDLFLLRFQDHLEGQSTYAGPEVTLEQYCAIFQTLSCTVVDVTTFHPFYHEIVLVQQAQDDNAPIELVDVKWPCLMLGSMLFSRAGVVVRGGVQHIRKEIAERSTMYWTYRRRYRPSQDLSQGWGSNSQWRTDFRRDYALKTGYFYNVDAWGETRVDLGTSNFLNDELVPGASRHDRLELLRHRCFIHCALRSDNVCPYDDFYQEA
jgi:hypothetical protein